MLVIVQTYIDASCISEPLYTPLPDNTCEANKIIIIVFYIWQVIYDFRVLQPLNANKVDESYQFLQNFAVNLCIKLHCQQYATKVIVLGVCIPHSSKI